MANNIDWGKIYETTNFGSGRTDNTIDWGITYKDLGGGGAATTPLLDDYANAYVGYSLRKLSSSYTGNAIQVTPDGSTFTDIGFDADGNLDTASLPSDSNLYVNKWYDQAGTKNLINTSFSSMPIIKSGGSVIEVNGKPSISFDTSKAMYIDGGLSNQVDITSKNLTHILVTDLDTDPALREYALIGSSSSNGRWQWQGESSGNRFYYQSGGQQFSFFQPSGGWPISLFQPNIFILTHGDVGGNVKFYINADNPRTFGLAVTGTGQHQMWRIAATTGSNVTTQKMAEYILFNVDYDSSVSDINTAVNDYYGTYTA